jgi:2-C-methyl-D-erythritol 4-phosphate cytidylyltransferase/2-C-methyl-D-erythritol 2,4-cyclodiphosphate synthase
MGFDKVNINFRGKPLWRHSFDTFLAHPEVEGVGLVSSAVKEACGAAFVVNGGENRTESAIAGFNVAPSWAECILIHDAARPLVSTEVITRVIHGVRKAGAAYPAIPVIDTIKQVSDSGVQTLDRSQLVSTQTPQGALRQHFADCYRRNINGATDDMVLIEGLGIIPMLVEGEERNFKVTTQEDFRRLSAFVGTPETRTGLGYDIHRFSDDPSRPLMLGGVHFPDHMALEGHSDADVIIHAVVDALLGAASMGDIGVHFPNSEERWKNAPSSSFLEAATAMLDSGGWEIINVDVSVVAEAPKVMTRSIEIIETLSKSMRVENQRVSIKATTNERLGAIGRSEGIAAFATATIRQRF